jgi:hypothetical protein
MRKEKLHHQESLSFFISFVREQDLLFMDVLLREITMLNLIMKQGKRKLK